ncbi:MAG: cell surface protein SprA [Rhodothermales bacterium]
MVKPVCEHSPLRTLSLLISSALVLLVSLVGSAARGDAPRTGPFQAFPARSDTDSVAVPLNLLGVARADTDSVAVAPGILDSLQADSLAADSLSARADSLAQPDTTYRARRYLPSQGRDHPTASLFPRKKHTLSTRLSPIWRHELTLDSTDQVYIARETVGGEDVRYPIQYDFEQFLRERTSVSLERNWEQLIEQRARMRRQQQRGGLGVNIAVPGGRQSAFTTIFGKNEVDLRVTGNADIRTGFDYRKSDQQLALGTGTQIDPDFKQNLRLGVVGTIGDKMRVDVNWDTERDFDFQNQLKLQYTGYEDEILQSIEAGNVFLQTPSSLIRGGQSLFGIKSEFQVGGFRLTTVASQQEGQSNSLALDGGAETTPFDLKPTDYDERIHYFLSYYFRNRWEDALSQPPTILVANGFEGITEIEIWKLQPVSPEEQNVRQVVAMVDLGEPETILTEANAYQTLQLPGSDVDQYFIDEIENNLRPGDQVPKDFLESESMDRPLTASDYQVGQFKKLERGRDYEIDELLGYITLRQSLRDEEALAVSFKYLANGATFQIGDFSSDTGGGDNSQTGDRLVLKLLKPVNLRQPANLGQIDAFNPAAWYLEMRNIYSLRSRNIRPNEFELEIAYEPPGKSATKTLPGVSAQQTLIQLLGLDRINQDGATRPDNRFDYLPNYTIIPGDGRLIFPFLEPFGSHIDALITERVTDEADRSSLRRQFVFSDLYTQKKINAQRNTQLDVYRIQGSFKGAISEFYDLRAFSGVVPGSVRVTSGGATLQEGADYIVDYQGGTVTIINSSYLTAGRNIEIDYEQNALVNLQKKTLLGARLEYSTSDRFAIGATLMRMSQKSLTDKFRIGDEPIANTIWGIDGKLDLQPRWLTRAIDALPLIQTKAPSAINISAEIAQLLPGHTVTNTFKETRRDLKKKGRDFTSDELDGISYVDDFESFENTTSLSRPGAWQLGASPIIGVEAEAGTGIEQPLTNETRGVLGWYQLNETTLNQLVSPSQITRAIQIFTPQDVFPNRERNRQERTLPTLDLFFTPHERGPYNLTEDLAGFISNPRAAWGGITQRLTEGNTDFTSKNIEFVEFIFQPFSEGASADPDAKLYVDLGLISEDLIPDNKLNTEDGLSLNEGGPVGTLARLSTGQQDQVINPINAGDRITEDLGLDGLASFPENKFEGAEGSEEAKYVAFLNSLDTVDENQVPSDLRVQLRAEISKARRDPSGDDYHYFLDSRFYNDPTFYPNGASVQQRFSHFFSGLELNSFEGQTKLSDASGDGARGNSRFPDTEDLNLNSTLDTESSYFQYELPLNLDLLDELARPDRVDDYVVEEIEDEGVGTGWYLVRIPVKDFTRRVGTLQDFTKIESIRLWTTGHTTPITLRFATLELVGSQWRKSEAVSNENAFDASPDLPDDPPDPLDETRISIESVNNEENASYAIPLGTVLTQIRETTTGQPIDAREQSMVLRVENLEPGRQLAVFQTYNTQAHDLLKYNHLRMFLHLHGTVDGLPLQEEDRGKVKLFVRLGANETNDYYEYEQSLTPSPIGPEVGDLAEDPDYLWRTNQTVEGETGVDLNSMDILLSALNQLKFVRDEMGARTDTVFWNDENGVLEERVNEFAPPGTRIGIKGTPSLGRVNTIVIGIRNPATDPDGTTFDDVTVWVNELRVSGYDEKTGTAALINANLQLADLATVKANYRMQTDGFGSLSSTLDEREQVNVQDWAVNTQFNMHKFIPERFGWTVPLTVEFKSNTSTPRFDPNRGDVRVNDLLDAIEAEENLSADEIARRKDDIIEQAQTHAFTRSFTSSVQKSGSRSRLLRNTIDGLSLNYSYTDTEGRTPNQELRNSWRWQSSLGYRLTVRKPRVFRPFGFLGKIPVLNVLGGLRFNYLPSALSFTASAARSFSETKERPDPIRQQSAALQPRDVEFPLRPQHTFTHNRRFNLQYSPLGFLNLSFDTNTDQSFNALGVDTLKSVILFDTDADGNLIFDENGNPVEIVRENTTLQTLLDAGEIVEGDIGETAFEVEDLNVVPFKSIINRIRGQGDGPSVRTESYQSRFNATFRPQIQKIKPLDWITIQDIGYGASFSWRNGSVGNNTGATVGTVVDLRGGITIRPQGLFQKFGFYRKLEEQQRQAEQAAKTRRDQRDRERQQRRQARREAKEQQRQLEEARRAAEEAGQPFPEPEAEEEQPPPPEETPPQVTPPDEEGGEDTEEKQGGGFKLPLPNPVGLLRQTFLAITGIRDFTVTYNGTRRSDATNVGRADADLQDIRVNYSLLDAFKGQGPSLAYRFGFDRRIDPNNNRIVNDRLKVTDFLSDTDRLQARTSFNPTRSLRITLNWNVEQTESNEITYRRLISQETGESTIDETSTMRGDNKASVWAFGVSYLDLLSRQIETFRGDFDPSDPTGTFGDENGDGRVVLTNESVAADFLDAYLSGLGALDGSGRLPFPMPGWQVNYDGISSWPLIRWIAQSATLRHGYSADYSTDFQTNLSSQLTESFVLQGGPEIEFDTPDIKVGAVRINERYQPLLGLDLNIKGGIQAGVAWSKSNTYSLSTTNNQVSETKTSELTVTTSYQRQGLKLPFMSRRLNNRITFSLTLSHTTNDDRFFLIRRAVEEAALRETTDELFNLEEALEPPFVSILTTTSRFRLSPKISYQFSNRVSADAFVNYERFEGDSRRPSTTTINGGFNIRVSISN